MGNAKQAAYYYRAAFGMKLVAYRGPETGDARSRFLRGSAGQDPLRADHSASARSIRSPSMSCCTATAFMMSRCGWTTPNRRIARPRSAARAACAEPETLRDEHGEVRISAIAAYGETIHTFVERRNYSGAFLPGYVARSERRSGVAPGGLAAYRPHGGQCRLGRDERVGGFLRAT